MKFFDKIKLFDWFKAQPPPYKIPTQPITREQVIEWGQMSGVLSAKPYEGTVDALEVFAKFVADYEREECAQLAELAEPFFSHDLIRQRSGRVGLN